MRETWYVLEDGRSVDPNECSHGNGGVLVHSSGVAVAMRAHDVPSSRSVDPDQERANALAAAEEAKRKADAEKTGKDVKPEEQKQGYKTRDVKGK